MGSWLVAITRIGMAVALGAAAMTLWVAADQLTDPLTVLLTAMTLLALSVPIVGGAAVRSAPRNPVGWLLLVSGVSLPLAISGLVYSRAVYEGGTDLPFGEVAAWFDGWLWVPALALVPTIGVLLFPDGRVSSPPWRVLLWTEIAVCAALMLSLMFEPSAFDYPDVENITGLPGRAGDVAAGLGLTIALLAPATLGSAVAFERRRLSAADATLRATLDQVRPAVWLFVLSWWGCIVLSAAGGNTVYSTPAEAIAMATLGVGCWVAIRRYRLFDAQLAVRRGLVYGALTVLVFLVYVAVAEVLALLGSSRLTAPAAVAVAVVVAVPLRDRLQRAANRLVFGLRDDPLQTFLKLGDRLESSGSPDQLLTEAAGGIRQTLRLGYVAIQVGDEVLAESGQENGLDQLDVPLVFARERIGTLVVQPSQEDSVIGPRERTLLAGLAGQLAAGARATALSRDLSASRERLVAATEDERRRLRRDLHDGLGPTLSSAVLGLRRTQSLLRDRPDEASRQIDQLTESVQDAVTEVRRLVYGLRPPALDELGLMGALEEKAQALGPITVEGPPEELTLGAAVEVAAYRIAVEAMTNAVRHSGASSVTVDVRVDGCLHLEIADDGAGLPESFRAGVGISSMRERAGQLGGTIDLLPRTPNGTVVRAEVPLEPA